MKKYLFPVFLYILFASACNVLQEKQTDTVPLSRKAVVPPPVEKPSLHTKYYKFKTGQNYTRVVERKFYGMLNDMQDELSKYDVKKGFNIEQYNKYGKASFFATDEYSFPSEIKPKAVALYKPLIDTLFAISSNKKVFHAEILVLGYTDESAIPINASVYNELMEKTKSKGFYNNDYYNALSFFRAQEVATIISELINSHEQYGNFDKVSFDVLIEGRGIEYPDAKRSYELEDDKRKITKVYWKLY